MINLVQVFLLIWYDSGSCVRNNGNNDIHHNQENKELRYNENYVSDYRVYALIAVKLVIFKVHVFKTTIHILKYFVKVIRKIKSILIIWFCVIAVYRLINLFSVLIWKWSFSLSWVLIVISIFKDKERSSWSQNNTNHNYKEGFQVNDYFLDQENKNSCIFECS